MRNVPLHLRPFPALALLVVAASIPAACSSSSDTAPVGTTTTTTHTTTGFGGAGGSGGAGGDTGSGGAAGASPDGGTGDAMGAFCGDLAATVCDGTAGCGCPADPPGSPCLDRQRGICEKSFAALVGGVVLGDLAFDSVAAAACLAAVKGVAEACAEPTARNRPIACQSTFVDGAKLGGPCSPLGIGLLCAGGTGACGQPGGPGAATCEPLPKKGGACPMGRCDLGLACVDGACADLGAEGAPCSSDDGCAVGLACGVTQTCAAVAAKGDPCLEATDCAAGLVCAIGVCADGPALGATCGPAGCGADHVCSASIAPPVCRAKGAVGEACSSYDDCQATLGCDAATLTPTCKVLPAVGSPCILGQCAEGVACDVSQVCVAAPKLGEACLSGASIACGTGLGCSEQTGLCAPAGKDGEACAGGICVAGAACDFLLPATCHVLAAAGAACAGDWLCEAGLYCDPVAQACATPGPAGAACASDLGCAGGYCEFGPKGGLCVDLPATLGADCQGRCGGGLRCAAEPGTCAHGACALR